MSTIQYLFQQAQLAEAAYADFSKYQKPYDALKDEGMTEIQATEFLKHWMVVNQYTAAGGGTFQSGTGFSATLFRSKDGGPDTFAIRGTEPGYPDLIGTDYGDLVVDGLPLDQLVDMYNYWQSLKYVGQYQAAVLETDQAATLQLGLAKLAGEPQYTAELQNLKNSGAIIDTTAGGVLVRRIHFGGSSTLLAGTALAQGSGVLGGIPSAIDITGHSLGGNLAAAFGRMFSGVNATVTTFNGAGFPIEGLSGNAASNIQNLFNALGGATSFDASRIQNIVGDGTKIVSMDSQDGLVQPGKPQIEIFIESHSGYPSTFGHGIPQMVDSLALYKLFGALDPVLNSSALQPNLDKITGILKASSAVSKRSLENTLDAVRTLVEDSLRGDLAGKVEATATDSREALYKNLQALNETLIGFGQPTFTIESITAYDAASISAQAQGDIAWRYALYRLNPFTLNGQSGLYEAINQNGELDLYDPDTQQGNLSKEWLVDRAAMLAWKNKFATEDYVASAGNSYQNAPDAYFKDVTSGEAIYLGNPQMGNLGRAYYIFGSDTSETINGGAQSDRFYGMGGDDVLNGGNSADYLEGGKGKDTLDGGAGDDALYANDGAGGDNCAGGTGYDTFYVDEGDHITDTDGHGKVILAGKQLGFASRKRGASDPCYYDRQGHQFSWNGSTLGVNGLTIHGYTQGALGIYLDEYDDGGSGSGSGSGSNQPNPGKPKPLPYLPGGSKRWMMDPLALDLDHDGKVTTIASTKSSAYFDFNDDGIAEKAGWIAAQDGLLALDTNGNGVVDGLSELFGTAQADGFADLATLDSNGDTRIDKNDVNFAKLRVWQDLNGDGISQAAELKTLAELRIDSIDLNASEGYLPDAGNIIANTAHYSQRASDEDVAEEHLLADVLFAVNFAQTDSNPNRALDEAPDLDSDIFELPWLRGYSITETKMNSSPTRGGFSSWYERKVA